MRGGFGGTLGALLVLVGCSDPAEFRPAKGVKDLSAVTTAYRIKQADLDNMGCDELGGVIKAASIDDVAVTAANHGGTHYLINDDFGHSTVETDTVGGYSGAIGGGVSNGAFVASSTSEIVKHHRFVARVYRCK